MGMPVKLSDDLVLSARLEAEATDRSITAQIEHWAKIRRQPGRGRRRVKDGPAVARSARRRPS